MKIAWFTPFNPESAIGTYSEAILDVLAQRGHKITVFAPGDPPYGKIRSTSLRVVPIGLETNSRTLDEAATSDIVVYNMGNCFWYHAAIYEYARRLSGVVVLHDVVMRHFFIDYTYHKYHSPEWLLKKMREWHGVEAEQHAARAYSTGSAFGGPGFECLEWPLFGPVLENCQGVVVHSAYARERIAASLPYPLATIDFPRFGPSAEPCSPSESSPSEQDTSVSKRILTFGLLSPNKCIDLTIRAIGDSQLLRERTRFDVIGDGSSEYKQYLESLVEEYGLTNQVRLLGRQSDEVLMGHLKEADVVVNLRYPHMGESSASLVDALFSGVATVVWNHGYYAEFSDDIVCKVSRANELQPVLERLIANESYRRELGERSRQHALDRFDTQKYCERLEAFVEELTSKRPAVAFVNRVAMRLKEMGVDPHNPILERIADETSRMTTLRHRAA